MPESVEDDLTRQDIEARYPPKELPSLEAPALILTSPVIPPTNGKRSTFNRTNEMVDWAKWTWNPVTGCLHDCVYCLAPETLILMADGRTQQIQTLRVGDRIIGTQVSNYYRRLVITEIQAHWKTRKPAYEITLADGRTLVCSADHRWLTDRGVWKYTAHSRVRLDARGKLTHEIPNLTTNNQLLGFGTAQWMPLETEDYRAGYLSGVIRGDGHLKIHRGGVCSFRLAMQDVEAVDRAERYLAQAGIPTTRFSFSMAVRGCPATAIRTSDELSYSLIEHEIKWRETSEYQRGFLAGLFDAEGANTGNGRYTAHTALAPA